MEYRILGSLEVRDGDRPIPLGGAKQRALLALLLLNANRVVSRDSLIDGLWGEAQPETAVQSVQVYVSRLRKLLPPATVVTKAPGYMLDVEPEDVDLQRFEGLLAGAHRADPERASLLLHEALALWRGPALAEFAFEPFAQTEIARLDDLRVAATEERVDADLELGRDIELVGELESLITEYPHRERLRGQLMLALYRAGRQPEALEAYRQTRAVLDALGIEPSERLRTLERGILNQDPGLDLRPARLLLDGQVPLPGPLVASSPFPFVGRADEFAALRALLERAKNGEGGVALMTGVAGAGKTRLVHEFAREAAAGGALVLYGSSDSTVATPYQPLREWLAFLLRVGEYNALRQCLGEGVGQLAQLVPELGRLASASGHSLASVEIDRYLVQSAAAEALTRLAALQPLVLVADDLHWAESATLQLVTRLARMAPESRMLLVVVLRSPGEEITPQLADALGDFSRLDAVTRIALGDLSSDDVSAFIRASTDAEAVPELLSEIGELTNGTPLLLCELWRDLRETGGVEVLHTVQLSRPFEELRASEPIRDFMRQRLSRLATETKALVELAAVAGTRAELEILGEASGLEPARLVTVLDRAAAAGLLEALPERDLAWRFTHELVRRAVYDRLESAPRAELHLRVGEALERTYASEPTRGLPELAHHFTLAASVAGVERAVDYNLRAATAFAATADYDLAEVRLATALELGIADRGDRARVQRQLAYILRELGRHEEAAPILAASVDAAVELGEPGFATITVIDGIQAMGDPRVDLEQARSTVEHAIETLEELGDPGDLALATRWLGLVLRRQGRLAEARAALERALEHANAAGDQDKRRHTIGSLLNALTDGPEPVDVGLRRCEELRRESGRDPALAAVITCFASALLAMAGRFDAAIAEDAAAATALLDKSGHTTSFWLYQVSAVVNTKELLGDRAGAQRELAARSNWFRKQGSHKPDARAMSSAYRLALMYCDDGRWDDAEHWLAYGSEVPVPAYFLIESATGLAARARVAAHRGAPADAVTLARRAVELMDVSDHLNHRALIWLALAEVERANGDSAKAHAASAKARALYEQKGNVAAAALI